MNDHLLRQDLQVSRLGLANQQAAIMSSPSHQQASAASGACINSHSLVAPKALISVTLLESITTETTTTTTANNGSPEVGKNLPSVLEAASLNSPKRSIFDGASKDEILTYLKDARERVPDLLMAADEVMVISENELLLVNQLEPNSPATPISIVETDEIMGSNGLLTADVDSRRGLTVEQVSIPISAQSSVSPPSSSSVVLVESCHSASLDDQISLFDVELKGLSRTDSNEQDTAATKLLSSLIDEPTQMTSFISLDLPPTPPTHQQRNDSNSDDEPREIDNSQSGEQHLKSQFELVNLKQIADEAAVAPTNGEAMPTGLPLGECHVQLVRTLALDHSGGAKRQREEASLLDAPLCISERVTNMLRQSTRRKSTSENSTQTSESKRVARLMMLQQCHSQTHDSISSSSNSSSSSSTPASSSSSNSRSNSSNQTSGNCSGTSNFYTSPSLSCSSPFLGNVGTTNHAMLTSPARQAPAAISGAYANDLVQLLPATPTTASSPLLAAQTMIGQLGSLVISRSTTMNGTESADQTLIPTPPPQQQNSADFEAENLSLLESKSLLLEDPSAHQPISNASSERTLVTSSDSQLGSIDERDHLFGMVVSSSPEPCDRLLDPLTDLLRVKEPHVEQTAQLAIGPPLQAQCKPAAIRSHAARPVAGHGLTISRLNNYLVNRHRANGSALGQSSALLGADMASMVEFQCLDCDQFIVTDHARVLHKANELRLLRESEIESLDQKLNLEGRLVTLDQINRAYIVALNGLPLCHYCEKKRTERREIISEFLDTELKYGRDLKIIHDEFYRPMQIAGLLTKEQIIGIFSNLEELIMAHCRFAGRIEAAVAQAQAIGDAHYNTINIGKLFNESADMLHTFESYCIRQAAAACLLARLDKEKELFRIFLRVSQMENALLRRMNLAAFLMVPVQRVTKYPLLLNRLYKVTAYHHKDREALRDAQLKVELHLEHINQQTKGMSATNKIWRRISNLSGQQPASSLASSRRALVSAEDIGYIKLRKTAMELLKWDRDEAQFIHSGRVNFAPLNEFIVRQKIKSVKYMQAHALLVVLGKPNWRYRPDLVKSHVDYKLLTPTPGANGVREAALLLLREKNGRFVACREPFFLSNCVLSADCSQYNIDTSHTASQTKQQQQQHQTIGSSGSGGSGGSQSSLQTPSQSATPTAGHSASALVIRRSSPCTGLIKKINQQTSSSSFNEFRAASADTASSSGPAEAAAAPTSFSKSFGSPAATATAAGVTQPAGRQRLEQTSGDNKSMQSKSFSSSKESESEQGDSISMSSLKSLPEERNSRQTSPPPQAARSFSLASALPHSSAAPAGSHGAPKQTSHQTTIGSLHNRNILNPFKSKASLASTLNNNNNNQTGGKAQVTSEQYLQAMSGPTTTMTGGSNIDNNTSVPMQSEASLTASGKPGQLANGSRVVGSSGALQSDQHQPYNHHFFFHNHHQQPYGDYEESFEIHERLSKESLLLRADTPLKTRYWLQMLRYHAKDLGQWRQRRPALANIMMMRQDYCQLKASNN